MTVYSEYYVGGDRMGLRENDSKEFSDTDYIKAFDNFIWYVSDVEQEVRSGFKDELSI